MSRVLGDGAGLGRKAVVFGGIALALVLALVGAWFVARQLARPIQRLADDAAQITSGYLPHRATVMTPIAVFHLLNEYLAP